MAVRTAAGDARVIHLTARETGEVGQYGLHVAAGAECGVASWQVVDRHAGGAPAVMTGRTSSGVASKRRMRKTLHRQKRHRGMANVTRQIGGNVLGRLPRRTIAVMASAACAGLYRRMTEHDGAKRADIVAAVTTAGDLNVSVRHCCRATLIVHHMTADAVTWR